MASRRSYWKVLNGVRSEYTDLTLRDARAFWRLFRDWLGRPPFGTDLIKHPRKVQEFVNEVRQVLPPVVVPPPLPPLRAESEEWEVTWRYKAGNGRTHHITVRLVGPAGATRDHVLRVFWRALNGRPLDHWKVSAVDWEQASRTGRGSRYSYTTKQLATPEFRNFWNHGTVRVEPVGD